MNPNSLSDNISPQVQLLKESSQIGNKGRYHITYTHSRNSLLLMVPDGFSAALLNDALNLGRQEAKAVWPKATFFLSNLIERSARNTNPDCEVGVPVNAHLWQCFLGHRYSKRIKDGLTKRGVITRVAEKDQGARKSERYCIGREFENQPLKWEVVRSAPLAARMRGQNDEALQVAAKLEGGRRLVWDNLQSVTAAPRLFELLNNPDGLSTMDQARMMLAARALVERRFWLSYPSTGDRLYHSLACVQTGLREHLLIRDEEVCEADMSCAQPFLCLSLYPNCEGDERNRYGKAVSSGMLYEMLRDALPDDERAEMLKHWDRGGRGTLKQEVCRSILFAGMSYPLPSVFVAFAKLFPVLARILAGQRRTKAGATALAAKMRCMEASLMFDRVVPRICAELAGCVPITIHDAIMCQRRFAPGVVQIIGDEAEKMFGVRPRVSVKNQAASLKLAG